MFSEFLTRLLEQVDASMERLGWDQPAVVTEVFSDVSGTTLELASVPLCSLDGHPVCELWRQQPTIAHDAAGAILSTEAWAGDSPAGRQEVRLVELFLRDGTEMTLVHRRGGSIELIEGPKADAWPQWLMRRVCEREPLAEPPAQDLGLRIVLLWQVSNLLMLRDSGFQLDRLSPSTRDWGHFVLPGGDAPPMDMEQSWWDVCEDWVMGEADPDALTRAITESLDRSQLCLPASFPLVRGNDEVILTPSMARWAPALVPRFVEDTVPELDQIIERTADALPQRFSATMAKYVTRWRAEA